MTALLAPAPLLNRPLLPIDDSWKVGLQMAHRQHLHWGTDVMWTYGPYGYLVTNQPYFAHEFVIALITGLLIHAVFIATAAIFLWSARAGIGSWLLSAMLLFLPSLVIPSVDGELVVGAWLLFYLALTQLSTSRIAMAAAAAAALLLALASLFKFSAAVESAGLIGMFFVTALVVRQRWLALAAPTTYCLGVLMLWSAAGQRLTDLPGYVSGSAILSSGYGAAMAINGISVFTLTGAALCVALALMTAYSLRHRHRRLAILLSLSLPLLAVHFKDGFVRADEHILVFNSLAVLIVWLVALELRHPLMRSVATTRWLVPIAYACLFVLGIAMLGSGLRAGPTLSEDRVAAYRLAAGLLTSGGQTPSEQDSMRQRLRNYYDLPPTMQRVMKTGSSDVLPWDILALYAYRLDWTPRPAFQSYNAFAPRIDQADAKHFTQPGAPDHVLYEYKSIDGRYPIFDEPATMQALIWNYRLTELTDRYLLFSRSANAAPVNPRAESHRCAQVGAELEVPQLPGRLVFASIQVPYSTAGSLANLAFKPGSLLIDFQLDEGGARTGYRFIQGNASDGMLVSSYVGSNRDFADLVSGRPPNAIRSFRIHTDHPLSYAGLVCANYFSVPFESTLG